MAEHGGAAFERREILVCRHPWPGLAPVEQRHPLPTEVDVDKTVLCVAGQTAYQLRQILLVPQGPAFMGGQRIGRTRACDPAEHEEFSVRRHSVIGNSLFDIGPAEPFDPLALQAPLSFVGEAGDDVGASLIMAARSLNPDFGGGMHLFQQHGRQTARTSRDRAHQQETVSARSARIGAV